MAAHSGSTKYQYLSLPERSILSYRIFTLAPASDFADALHGSLRIIYIPLFDFNIVPIDGFIQAFLEEFEALSYAWGDVAPTSKVMCADNSYIPIAANLESFLRHRRQTDVPISLWIDAICINQDDVQEKNSQVAAMGRIYSLATRLTIWLGPPSPDSAFAIKYLCSICAESPFSKLSTSKEQRAAVQRLLQRAWWCRAWITQEIAFGAGGRKHLLATLRCGPESIRWCSLTRACARMYANALNMRQNFPDVTTMLKLDELATRGNDETIGTNEPYSCRLLRQLSKHRNRLASDPRDKVYSLVGLWVDTFAPGMPSNGRLDSCSSGKVPVVNYNHDTARVYTDFASWILNDMQTLQLLHNCQPLYSSTSGVNFKLPTWVPDWSQTLPQARLPSARGPMEATIPWWSLPRQENGRFQYLFDDQPARQARANEMLRPTKSTLHYVPEWLVDVVDPDGTKGEEEAIIKLQKQPDWLFFFPDESSRALGENEDVWTIASRVQDHNERVLQRIVLSRSFHQSSHPKSQYSASGKSICNIDIKDKELTVNGIFCDTIRDIFNSFPEEIEEDWKNSTRLMVQIGRCKREAYKECIERGPYRSEMAKMTAFWTTLLAGQTVDISKITSWLPLIRPDWQWNKPTPTVLESGRLEYAEISAMGKAFAEYYATITPHVGSKIVHENFDEGLANDEMLLDASWTETDRSRYQQSFEELGKLWCTQPYDLYHRPFNLPYIVPDPYWTSRRIDDKLALEQSIQERTRSVIESVDAPDREGRRAARLFMRHKISQQPAREPRDTGDASLIKYALGRRFFISGNSYFGLAPPEAQIGDQVAVLFGANTPFILRQKGSKFQMVGESYVHGLMDGEAVNMWRLGTKEIRNIVLI